MLEITSITPSELIISSAPNSTAFSKKSSSSTPLLGKLILPFRSKFQDTHPDSPRFPPNFEKALLVRDWEPNKVFFLIDLFFSKQRIYFTKKKIKSALIKLGYKKIIFLKRGPNQDLNEKLFKNPSLKKIYGEGEIRLIAK